MPSLKEQFWDPVAGFGVTFRTMFKKVVTQQYPFEKRPTAPRFHGRHQLNRWPDGLERHAPSATSWARARIRAFPITAWWRPAGGLAATRAWRSSARY